MKLKFKIQRIRHFVSLNAIFPYIEFKGKERIFNRERTIVEIIIAKQGCTIENYAQIVNLKKL